MNPFVLIIMFSLVLLLLVTRTASQLATVGGDDTNDVRNKCLEKERDALLLFKSQLQDIYGSLSSWTADGDECCQWSGVTCSDQTGHVIKLDIYDYGLAGEVSHSLVNLTHLNFLDLSRNSFHGTIPKSIGSLTKLSYLELGFNSFQGTIPKSIGSLTELRTLDLSGNSLYGTIPRSIGFLSELRYLSLSHNSLYGTIPLEFGNLTNLQQLCLASVGRCRVEKVEWLSHLSHLEDLNLDGISLVKANHWVDAILSLPNLSRLSLEGCELSQVVSPYSSSFLNSSSSSIEYLYLGNNNLTSSMYAWLSPLTGNKLRELSLSGNMLDGVPIYLGNLCGLETLLVSSNSGELPLSLKNCTSLLSLNLGANKFSGNVPFWIGENLSQLYVLILRSNNFFGTIPLQSCQLANLHVLDLSMNNIHGTIPSCLSYLTGMVQQGFLQDVSFYALVSALERGTGIYVDHAMIQWQGDEREFLSTLKLLKSIDLSSNNLTGQIPYEITNLFDLIALNLSKNTLSGEIPQKIGEMRKLVTLDLSRNNLSGRIPSSMSKMSLLNYLDLSFNNLSDRIPSSTQLQSFDPSRYDGNAWLCGLPLTKNCRGDGLNVPPVVGESEGDGDDIYEEWGWLYIGGGMGFATGFWITCGALLLNRRGRHAFFRFYDSFKDWAYVKVVVFIASLQKARQT